MERDWQAQIQQWLQEGKDVDVIYSPRPKKDPTVLATPAAPPSRQEDESMVVPDCQLCLVTGTSLNFVVTSTAHLASQQATLEDVE
eukprot:5195017-Amphidinium_carterae.7